MIERAAPQPTLWRTPRTLPPEGPAGLDRWVVDAGYRLGWLAIGALLAWALLAASAPHRPIVLGLCIVAAGANQALALVPRESWLQPGRRRRLIDLWSAALVAFVAALVLVANIQFALLAFVTVPFIALANAGWRRTFWCSLAVAACTASTLVASVPVATTAVRLPLVIADVAVVLALARAFQREAREAELRRELTAEAHHRVKNSLQGVADLLYLAHGERDDDGLDRAADRIRSIAAVHELLARDGQETVAVDELLRRVAAGLDDQIRFDLEPVALPLERAQRVGIVANELLTNAAKYGRAPITLSLDGGDAAVRLTVEDAGSHGGPAAAGVGLRLVRHVVEYGLDGTLELASGERGTRAHVAFPRLPCAS